MNQSENTKALFLWTVRPFLGKHPEWLADTVLAMQGGIASALETERQKTASLAYSFVTVALAAPGQTERNKNAIQPGLKTLAEFFEGAQVAEQIRRWIEEENDE